MRKEKSQEIDEQVIPVPQTSENQEAKTAEDSVESKQSLMEALTQKSDTFAKESARKKRESEKEKIKFFLKGREISLREIKELIVANALPYSPKFPNEVPFYKEIFRLYSWDDKNPNDYIKPASVAKLTNRIIYGRFPKDVLPSLQILNGYLPGSWIRGYKNFQFLNEDGQKLVVKFRDEAIKIMETCNTMHEFRIKFSQPPYNVPYAYIKSMFNDEITPIG